ncbi:MAG: BamA/TamA family outer membrane protein [Acidobacteria bacterium]|nr:BamA/TamA family outer membrane protein [Acidobacteriota bacterium]
MKLRYFTPSLLFLALHLGAQQAEPPTRQEAERAEQDKKAADLKPVEPDKVEKTYLRVMGNPAVKGFMGPTTGWTINFGNLYPGSGMALGPTYTKKGLLKENLDLTFSASGSVKLYYNFMVKAAFDHLAEDRGFFDVIVQRNDAPQVDYYGPGNDSAKEGRTNYRYENVSAEARAGFRPWRRILETGVMTGWSRNNVGPGQSDNTPSTETVYGPLMAPGINVQTPYVYIGPFLSVDTRDYVGDPHKGTYAVGAYSYHKGLDWNYFSYRRLRVGVDHYIPFLNEKRVIALRSAGVFSYLEKGHTIPIYEQLTIGGPDDVRGLPRFRYYGTNAFVTNLEYRWEVAPALALAFFADAGRVSNKPGDLAISGMHGSAGVGLRFKSRNALAMRIDVGFSPQGVQFWWTFSDLFRRFSPSPF